MYDLKISSMSILNLIIVVFIKRRIYDKLSQYFHIINFKRNKKICYIYNKNSFILNVKNLKLLEYLIKKSLKCNKELLKLFTKSYLNNLLEKSYCLKIYSSKAIINAIKKTKDFYCTIMILNVYKFKTQVPALKT